MPRQLVVITGPIGSGKTTVAREVAAEARRRGQSAAALDMDYLVQTLIGDDWLSVTPDEWMIARELAAGIAETLFLHEIETVIISGPFFTDGSREHLLQGFAIEPPTLFVLLRVSLEESLRRAEADVSRLPLIKDPEFLKGIYETIDQVPQQDIDIDTGGLTLDEVVALMSEQVLA